MKIYVRRENGKTEHITMLKSQTASVHDLKQEIQIKYGYPVQTQKIMCNERELGCGHRFDEVDLGNGSLVDLKLEDAHHDDDNFTVEYNGFVELNSYVPRVRPDTDVDRDEEDEDDEDEDSGEDDYWSVRIRQWRIHKVSDKIGQSHMIAIVCYQYDGKVEWNLNGIKCKSGDVILKNITSLKICQYETMYQSIFKCGMNGKFVGNGFKVNKNGKIKQFSNEMNELGKIERFWLDTLIEAYHTKGIKFIDIESYQKQNSRYRYDIDKYSCDLCGVDGYIEKEGNKYMLVSLIK
mmetsp:Transcript_1135/g.1706  ORF Transcript_1135/g.1706 Transcript_1135/m.1706 type:complete len:293 (-) Transcript_1135:168-1046(-)